jgi:hypothetical protein
MPTFLGPQFLEIVETYKLHQWTWKKIYFINIISDLRLFLYYFYYILFIFIFYIIFYHTC